MEWVETTGPTVEDALDAALDELGVDEDEVEFEVIQEAKSGLFGRIGGNPARIRARVKPLSREKPGDRNRGRGPRSGRRNGGKGGSGKTAKTSSQAPAAEAAPAAPAPRAGSRARATMAARRMRAPSVR